MRIGRRWVRALGQQQMKSKECGSLKEYGMNGYGEQGGQKKKVEDNWNQGREKHVQKIE